MDGQNQRVFFPNLEWKFIKSLRWLEYCENVKKKSLWGRLSENP